MARNFFSYRDLLRLLGPPWLSKVSALSTGHGTVREKVPLSSSLVRRCDDGIGHVRRREVERNVLPGLQRLAQRGRPASGAGQDLGPIVQVVAARVARLDHRLDGDAVGRRALGDAVGVADRAAAEL